MYTMDVDKNRNMAVSLGIRSVPTVKVYRDCKEIFAQPGLFMAESIVSPEFVPFLMENKDCVLIIEDAEKVIGDRQSSGSSVGVSNLLNLSDGILGDILNIHIIATFNMDKEKIDSALLRKGRLIAEHKFGKLTVDETNKLLKNLFLNYIYTFVLLFIGVYTSKNPLFKSSISPYYYYI